MSANTGTHGDDTLVGTGHNDILFGASGNDTLVGNGGSDYFSGGAGLDTVVLPGTIDSYSLNRSGSSVLIESVDDQSVAWDVEIVSFIDGDVDVTTLTDLAQNANVIYDGVLSEFNSQVPTPTGSPVSGSIDLVDLEALELASGNFVYSTGYGDLWVHSINADNEIVLVQSSLDQNPVSGFYGDGYVDILQQNSECYLLTTSFDGFSLFEIQLNGEIGSSFASGSDNSNLKIDAVSGMYSWTKSGSNYWAISSGTEDGFSVFELSAGGTVSNTHNGVSAAFDLGGSLGEYTLTDISALVHVEKNGRDFIYAASTQDTAIGTFELLSDGSVVQIDLDYSSSFFPSGNEGQSRLAHINSDGTDYVFFKQEGVGLDGYIVQSDGTLEEYGLFTIGARSTFNTQMAVADYNGRPLLIINGRSSDFLVQNGGIGIYELRADGLLFEVTHIDGGSIPYQASGVASFFDGDELIVVAGSSNGGQRLSYSVDLTTLPDGNFHFASIWDNNFIGSIENEIYFGDMGADSIDGDAGDDVLLAGEGADYVDGDDGRDVIEGGPGADTLEGGGGDDFVSGSGGNDTLRGQNDDDTLDGGDDNDRLEGGAGADSLLGGDGNDTVFGGGVDADTLDGGRGTDLLFGEQGNDLILGGDGFDNLRGGGGDDSMDGGNGNDTLVGGSGNDTLLGNVGNDALFAGGGNDTLEGGVGNDELRGESGKDLLRGGADNDTLFGGTNDDTLEGGDGDDSLLGGAGNDELFGGPTGADTLDGGQGSDFLFAESADDLLIGGDGFDLMNGGAGDDSMLGGNGGDRLEGNLGEDTLDGGSGDDELFGGNGAFADTLIGGTGNDTLFGEQGADTFVFADGFGTDEIRDFQLNGGDVIDLAAVSAITSFTDLQNNHLSQDGVDAVITAGANSIRLTGIDENDLTAGDFDFLV